MLFRICFLFFQLVTNFTPKEYHLSSALLEVNKDKNRSSDLLPVELSRVRLPARPGVDGSDYINASFLHVSLHTFSYIVSIALGHINIIFPTLYLWGCDVSEYTFFNMCLYSIGLICCLTFTCVFDIARLQRRYP